ncbi:MAG: histidinol dehydrogenase, partial [Gammaproteobacteria bacterium]
MSDLNITKLDTTSAGFDQQLKTLLAWNETDDREIHQRVLDIITGVRKQGDKAVIDYTNRFDHRKITQASELELSKATLKASWEKLPVDQAKALRIAADRIRAYAEQQKMQSWQYTEADGTLLGQKITPLDRVGLYVPGGKAAYPSSVLMNAIPAKVAGVGELIMVVPAPQGDTNELVQAAAFLAGVDRVFAIGGAQAIAALAYGTETIPAVAKIVGPGNIYVATAKKLVFGQVGIDMIAGPSEILIICDGKTNPDWIAMDLFSQAEHDENAQAILISDNGAYLNAVEQSINKLLLEMERAEIIKA